MRTIINTLAALHVLGIAAFAFLISREGDASTNAHVSKRTDGPVMWCGSAVAAQYVTGGACASSLPFTGLIVLALLAIGAAFVIGGITLALYDLWTSR